MILQTERLTLRPLEISDVESVHALMSDAEIMAFWDVAEIDDIDLANAVMDAHLRDMNLGRAFHWEMIRRQDGAFVGCCDLSGIDRRRHRAEIGFAIGKPFWSDNYAYEAMQAVMSHAAQALHLRRLSARTHLAKVRSVRLLARLGFDEQTLSRGYTARDGERRDCLVFGLLL